MACLPRNAGDYCYCRTFDLEVLGPVGTTILTIPVGGTRVGGLPAGAPGQVLTINGGGELAWATGTTPGSHVLATNTGLGTSHTISGATAGMVLRATGATTAAFQNLAASDIPAHNIVTAHNASGLTNGHFMIASGATAFGFRAIVAADLPSHDLITKHPATGLTNGYVLTATGATSFAWQPPSVPPITDGAWTHWDSVNGMIDLRFDSPITVSTTDGRVVKYPTIQDAINAADATHIVLVPPGTYTENPTLNANIVVRELVRGTVNIVGAVALYPGASLEVDTITRTSSTAVVLLVGACRLTARLITTTAVPPSFPDMAPIVGTVTGHTGTSYLKIGKVSYEGAGSAGWSIGIENGYGGTLEIEDTIVSATNPGAGPGYGISAYGGGAAIVRNSRISAKTYDLAQADAGALTVHDVSYSPMKTFGVITLTQGDRANRDEAVKMRRMYR